MTLSRLTRVSSKSTGPKTPVYSDSFGVFDLTTPVTITKPDSGRRMMSLSTTSEDHSISNAIYKAGDFTFTQKGIGTRYITVHFGGPRTP
jgi:hypothetical protein